MQFENWTLFPASDAKCQRTDSSLKNEEKACPIYFEQKADGSKILQCERCETIWETDQKLFKHARIPMQAKSSILISLLAIGGVWFLPWDQWLQIAMATASGYALFQALRQLRKNSQRSKIYHLLYQLGLPRYKKEENSPLQLLQKRLKRNILKQTEPLQQESMQQLRELEKIGQKKVFWLQNDLKWAELQKLKKLEQASKDLPLAPNEKLFVEQRIQWLHQLEKNREDWKERLESYRDIPISIVEYLEERLEAPPKEATALRNEVQIFLQEVKELKTQLADVFTK